MINVNLIEIDQVIIHDIPERPTRKAIRQDASVDTVPKLSDRPSDLTDELRLYFEERLSNSLASDGYPVRFDPDTTSTIPALVNGYLSETPADFVETSRDMARRLHNVQTNITTAGLFAVISGQSDSTEFIAVMKLEREKGLVIDPVEEEDGQLTFRIVLEDDLVMTNKTKVFKAGLFARPDGSSDGGAGPIEGVVSDHQTGFRATKAVADFFLRTFLGCELLEQPELSTQRLFHGVEKWINRDVQDPVKKARYEQSLIAEIHSQDTTLSARRFRDRYVDVEDRNSFDAAMEKSAVPMTSFRKDIKLVEGLTAQVMVDTARGAKVYAPVSMWEDGTVTISTKAQDDDGDDGAGGLPRPDPDKDDDGPHTVIVVTDDVQRVRGG